MLLSHLADSLSAQAHLTAGPRTRKRPGFRFRRRDL